MIRKPTSILVAILAAGLALLPALVEAKAGRGGSMGSRGMRTYDAAPATPTAPSAAPVQRTVTPPPPTQTQPQAAPRPATTAGAPAAAQPGFFNRPFMPALMGGLIGMGIGGLLFGGGLFGEGGLGAMGFGGMIGLLLQLVLVFFIVRFALNVFRNRQQPAMAGGPQDSDRALVTDIPSHTQARTGTMLGGGAPALQIGDADFEAFQQALSDIQSAWSKADLEALRSHVTPEMLGYFGRELSALASQGLTNHVEQVTLEQGDLAEAWSEYGVDYATVAMRWSALDYTTDASGKVVEGSTTERGESLETWTFLRANNGRWILSAIQQI
ncbi:Tim44 domain-containing protein [Ferrovibrio xuzhouensis]|uniref:Tim44 domain-containing protein n=1 Tax=Ferrovibrio xuzhouensis TaxID=1576914 RepID=A0ABV7VCI5_9PROT